MEIGPLRNLCALLAGLVLAGPALSGAVQARADQSPWVLDFRSAPPPSLPFNPAAITPSHPETYAEDLPAGANACGDGSPSLCTSDGLWNIRRKKFRTGVRLLHDACQLNEPMACFRLAAYQVENEGTEAALWAINRSCQLGNDTSCAVLRNLGQASPQKARNCASLSPGECMRQAVTEETFGNLDLARQLFSQACDRGEAYSCAHLGLEEKQRQDGDRARATQLLTRACGLGYTSACQVGF